MQRRGVSVASRNLASVARNSQSKQCLAATSRIYSSATAQRSLWTASSGSQILTRQTTSDRFQRNNVRYYASGEIKVEKVPAMGDSVTEGTIAKWMKAVGERVEVDDIVVTLETDKVTMEIRATVAGVMTEHCAQPQATVAVGQDLFKVAVGETAKDAPAPKAEAPKAEAPKAAAPSAPKVEAQAPQAPPAKKAEAPKAEAPKAAAPPPAPEVPTPAASSSRGEFREPVNRLRARVAERLKNSQNTYALLTTFQDCDMHNLMQLRNQFKDEFFEKHNVKLGFMSAFVKASAAALRDQPVINAVMADKEIVYRDYVDISVAVATPKGLVVPVIRDCDKLSFADIEKTIAALGARARNGQISLEEMAGGTFTISNGGVYGSLMGTPIVNPPQSAILGMHAINDRPVVVNGEIKIRPIMYLALTYDHRLIDGKEAVTFLRKIKHCVEDPRRLLLDL